MARDFLEWMAINTQGAAQRHIKLSLGRLTFNNTTQTFDPEIKKQTAAASVWFRYDGYPLYLEEVKVLVNETPMRRMSSHFLNNGSIELSGDMIRISTLRCFHGSILNNFLERVQNPKKVEVRNKTAVAYIRPKIDRAQWDDPDAWQCRTRTSRPLPTIDLDPKVKEDLIITVDHFVAPKRPAWYQQRGIPYLFGVLFHGEPGTGKSSTAFVLASHLKKTFYTLNLVEVADEAHLRKLFRRPSAGDVLLIEDIDSAGLRREKMIPKTNHDKSGGNSYSEYDSSKRDEKKGGITIQGFFNAIDTAGEEGVILIMTTNKPRSLDPALTRPGLVDKTIEFDCATKAVTESIFTRMYQVSSDEHDNNVSELAIQFFVHTVLNFSLFQATQAI